MNLTKCLNAAIASGMMVLFAVFSPDALARSKYYNPSALANAKARYESSKTGYDNAIVRFQAAKARHDNARKANVDFLEKRAVHYQSLVKRYIAASANAGNLELEGLDDVATKKAWREVRKLEAELDKMDAWQHQSFSLDVRQRLQKLEKSALEKLARRTGQLNTLTKSYAENLETYTRAFVDRGPRYLKDVTVRIEDKIYYRARFDPVPGNHPDDAAIDIELMRRELADIYETIATREFARLKALAELQSLNDEIARRHSAYQGAIWDNFKYPLMAEIATVAVEAVATGGGSLVVRGASQVGEKIVNKSALTRAVAGLANDVKLTSAATSSAAHTAIRNKLKRRYLIPSGSRTLKSSAAGNIKTNPAVDISGWSKIAVYYLMKEESLKTYGKLGLGRDGAIGGLISGEKLPAGTQAAVKSLTSDAIEFTINKAPPLLRDFAATYDNVAAGTWTSLRSGNKNILGKVKLTNIKEALSPKGLGVTLVASMFKAAVVKHFKDTLDDKQTRFMQIIAEAGYYVQMLDVHRAEDREIERLRKRYEIAIRDYEFRQKILDRATALELQRVVDDIYTHDGDWNALNAQVKIEADLVFSGSLEFAPTFEVAGLGTVDVKRLDNGFQRGQAWRATLDLQKSLIRQARQNDFDTLDISVSIDQRETYSALDSNPAMLALPTVFDEDWRHYDAGPDKWHRIKLKEKLDLTGRWAIVGGTAPSAFDVWANSYIYRVKQDGDILKMVYDDIPDTIQKHCKHPANRTLACLSEGQVFIQAKRKKKPTLGQFTEFDGKIYIDHRIKACGGQHKPTDVTLVISPNSEVIEAIIHEAISGAAPIRFPINCRVKTAKQPTKDDLILPSTSRLSFARRGSPLAESKLKLWQQALNSRHNDADNIALGFGYGFGFHGLGTRKTSEGSDVAYDKVVVIPNDGSESTFWELETLDDIASVKPWSPELNVEEKARVIRYQNGELTNTEGFAPAGMVATPEGVRSFLKDRGINSRADLQKLQNQIQPQADDGTKNLPPTPLPELQQPQLIQPEIVMPELPSLPTPQ